jgi:hypothetical protein
MTGARIPVASGTATSFVTARIRLKRRKKRASISFASRAFLAASIISWSLLSSDSAVPCRPMSRKLMMNRSRSADPAGGVASAESRFCGIVCGPAQAATAMIRIRQAITDFFIGFKPPRIWILSIQAPARLAVP